MTTDVKVLNKLTDDGWYKMEQVGYCVKGKNCGATQALRELHMKKNLSDIVYTSDDSEFEMLNKNVHYAGTGTGPLCYLW
ncbi:unnamed protein product [Cylicostephanus goldi]|uniref:Uncharacterized protein n=1 Tax=Cylicostephanus goldi TaxID=71465 RepID=A0A3P6RFX1_CYLGO|nr:unnamed protein product [Cylicostephanus goldi]